LATILYFRANMKNRILLFVQQHWDALITSVVAVFVIGLLTHVGGIGISPDSVSYASTAVNFREHFEMMNYNGKPLVAFPLGYPLVLSILYLLTGIRPVQMGPFLNMILYVALILIASRIMRSCREKSGIYRILILTLMALSPCLWEVYQMLWSETLFLVLTLLFVDAWTSFNEKGTVKALVWAALIAAMAMLTRFAGITLIATGAALLLFDGSISIRKKIGQILLFVLTGISLVSINLFRNHYAAGTLSGVRQLAERTLTDNLLSIGNVMGNWMPFLGANEWLGAAFFLVLLISAIASLCYRILQQQYYRQTETVLFGFFAIYAVFMLAVSSVSRFEELSSRLLSPMYLPLIWTGTLWIPAFLRRCTNHIRIFLNLALLLILVICIHGYYQQNAENWDGISTAGIPGYSEAGWANSPTAQYLRTNKKHLQIRLLRMRMMLAFI